VADQPAEERPSAGDRRLPAPPAVKRTTVFSSRVAQLATSLILLASARCMGQTSTPQPPTWDPTLCRQVLVLDVRKDHEGEALLISLCAPLTWWLKQSPAAPKREYPDTGLYPRPKS